MFVGSEVERCLWKAADVAAYLQVSKSWVRKKTADGTLPCRRFGANVRYVPEDIQRFALDPMRQRAKVVPINKRKAG